MGKYAIENYEQYTATVIRPKLLKATTETEHRTLVTIVELAWDQIEREHGVYHLSYYTEMLQHKHQAIVMLTMKQPYWVTGQVSEYASAFIRRMGSYLDGALFLKGIIVNGAEHKAEEWRAYSDSFRETTLYIDLHQDDQLHYFLSKNSNIGLFIRADESSYITCSEQLAKHRLNHFWEAHPVLLDVQDEQWGPILKREAQRWHVSYTTKQYALGYHFELRRLTFPQAAGSGGHLPLRWWFVNKGTAKVYEPFELRVKLSLNESCYEFALQAPTSRWLTGDLVHNELVKLPAIGEGSYKLHAGLFFEDGTSIPLNIENEQAEGYYELGEIKIEQWDENPFETIWDTYYPEGYYPLEDPELPAEE